MIRFACSQCQKALSAPDEHAGKMVSCPGCKGRLQIPGAPPVLAPQPVDPPPAGPASQFQFENQPSRRVEERVSALDEFIPGFEAKDEVPDELQAQVAALGERRRVYHMNFFNHRAQGGYALILIGFLGLGLAIFVATGRQYFDSGKYITLGVGFALGGFASALFCFYPHLARWGERVILYERGLVYLRWNRAEVHRFDRILDIKEEFVDVIYGGFGKKANRLCHYHVIPFEGSKLVLRETLQDIENLGKRLLRVMEEDPLRKLKEKLSYGEAVTFGPLRLDSRGVSRGQEFLPWNELDGAGLNDGSICVRRGGQWHTWRGGPVLPGPGMEPCLPLLEYAVAAQRRLGRFVAKNALAAG